MPAEPATNSLVPWEPWHAILQAWAESGELERAATSALMLSGANESLQQFTKEIASGDFDAIPDVELLSAESIAGNAGAYSIDTNKIYINADWLETASEEWAIRVLTEELGHHLDWLLNEEDTPGDEGEKLIQYLLDDTRKCTWEKDDNIEIKLENNVITGEASGSTGGKNHDSLINL